MLTTKLMRLYVLHLTAEMWILCLSSCIYDTIKNKAI